MYKESFMNIKFNLSINCLSIEFFERFKNYRKETKKSIRVTISFTSEP